ncbi:MAG: hypothetical protein KF816_06475 [Melioribacteraceae bacterium]|nr:hypothetical protein [Melioribacteraceae bacterium]
MAWCPHCKMYYDEDNDTQPCCGCCGHPISCCNDDYEYNNRILEELEEESENDEIMQTAADEIRTEITISNDSLRVLLKQFISGELAASVTLNKTDVDQINKMQNIIEGKGKNRIYEIKNTYKRAYEKWNVEEEKEMIRLFNAKISEGEIAIKLSRQPSAINSRLIKLGLKENKN